MKKVYCNNLLAKLLLAFSSCTYYVLHIVVYTLQKYKI